MNLRAMVVYILLEYTCRSGRALGHLWVAINDLHEDQVVAANPVRQNGRQVKPEGNSDLGSHYFICDGEREFRVVGLS
jgi:hypothetical protein